MLKKQGGDEFAAERFPSLVGLWWLYLLSPTDRGGGAVSTAPQTEHAAPASNQLYRRGHVAAPPSTWGICALCL